MVTLTLDAAAGLPEALPRWIESQRWYSGKGVSSRMRRIGGWSLPAGDAVIHTHYLLDTDKGGTATLYQVPLTERAQKLPGLDPVAHVSGRYLYDAPHDPAYAPAILRLMMQRATIGESDAVGSREQGAGDPRILSSSVLRAEQSNTSIVCAVDSGADLMVKLFRTLHHGENPDVTLQSVIAAAGSARVPRSVGSLTGSWVDSATPTGRALGHLAFVQEFLPGAEDAWGLALRAAQTGEDFRPRASALGEATAEIHATLAAAMPTRAIDDADIDAIVAGMLARLHQAIREVPALAELQDAATATFAGARSVRWPPLQRIHGDYHLGQALAVPSRGWVLVDFEGEPLRPMGERSALDLALRDVAGMLRSIDYAAGSVALAGGPSATRWAEDARAAFLDGYARRSGVDIRQHPALLVAFELDKALYEVLYEARNRPEWLDIPVSAIRHLLG